MSSIASSRPLLFLSLFAGMSCLHPALAAESGVGVELNKLEPADKNCRATLVVSNRDDAAYSELKLDLVVFDKEGMVAKRLIVDVAPLAAKKTTVKTFDIAGMGCDGMERLLLNDVPACGAGSDCLALVETSSRGAVTFFK